MIDYKQIFDSELPIIDVRSPAEFYQGHVPGAINMPLFSNEERHQVGLCFKKRGQNDAVKLGLEFVGPKLTSFVEQAEQIAPRRALHIYCWRGGMRSNSVATLLNAAGFKANVLEKGYKSWRKEVLNQMSIQRNWYMLGGYTGSGKTDILRALRAEGEHMIDLEGLAKHRGSAFGKVDGEQPPTEHFENLLAFDLIAMDSETPIWVENESNNIGSVYLHKVFRESLTKAKFIVIERSFENRVNYLVQEYGACSKEVIKAAFERIAKRLDGVVFKEAIQNIADNKIREVAATALVYYDKTYTHSMSRNPYEIALKQAHENDADSTAKKLIEWKNKL